MLTEVAKGTEYDGDMERRRLNGKREENPNTVLPDHCVMISDGVASVMEENKSSACTDKQQVVRLLLKRRNNFNKKTRNLSSS
jgi:hypothetical protein